ncbi:hypothetical protein V7S43_012010 [Phytophthora oleae]|uniref:Uncharacterized protein n=1 Tax=Phytophthora oleae TaxID=2107226 RepID=A0ABD3FC58_9STRA
MVQMDGTTSGAKRTERFSSPMKLLVPGAEGINFQAANHLGVQRPPGMTAETDGWSGSVNARLHLLFEVILVAAQFQNLSDEAQEATYDFKIGEFSSTGY